MTYRGTVKGGVVIPDPDAPLPEGATVTIEIERANPTQESLGEMLLRYAGCAQDLPSDFAAEHDHYIHGAPKRTEGSTK